MVTVLVMMFGNGIFNTFSSGLRIKSLFSAGNVIGDHPGVTSDIARSSNLAHANGAV